MATETRDQSASLAEVSRSFFTDPTGLPQSKNEDISCSQTLPKHVETSRFYGPSGSDGIQTPLSQLINTVTIGRRSLWEDVFIFCYLTLRMPGL